MARTEKPKPEAVLRLSELDTELVQALSKHWIVIIERQCDDVLIEIYTKA